jgi:hypothetical protein
MRACYAIGIVALQLVLPQSASAQGVILPWGQSSDMVGWTEFARITAPSGQAKKVEFETWASDDDIYVKNPAHWPNVDEPKVLQSSVLGDSHFRAATRRVRPQVFAPTACAPTPPQGVGSGKAAADSRFPTNGCIGEEVRRNWATFQYIVANALDTKAGRARFFANGMRADLPADALEFKGDWASVATVAEWLHVDPGVVRKSYYTSTSIVGGLSTEVALLSFHISTKQVKNWIWSDFEGALNPGRCDVIGCHDSFGAVHPNVEPNDKPWQSYGACAKTPALKAMLASSGIDPIWMNYCMKGTQVTFIDDNGQPILLGNSVIEPISADVPIQGSSCVTCHGYASFGADGNPTDGAFKGLGSNPVGNIDTSLLKGSMSYDFLWGILIGDK